jgi:hypothetical protein
MSNRSCLSSATRQWLGIMVGGFVLLFSAGCHHDIRFEDIGYSTGGQVHDAGLVATIHPSTLDQVVSIRSFATGIAHSWDARPGEMLRQIADVEFPQLFKYYRIAPQYEEPQQGVSRLTAELSISHYAFSDFHATVVIQARVYRAGRVLVFDRSYREEGTSQGGKMIGTGAFGMKSAVRQSSFDAYKKVFAKLRADLAAVLAQASP